MDPTDTADIYYELVVERHRRTTTIVTTNREPSEWGRTFTDPRLAAAVVDRVTYKAHIIETGSDSYRLRATRTAKKRAAANKN